MAAGALATSALILAQKMLWSFMPSLRCHLWLGPCRMCKRVHVTQMCRGEGATDRWLCFRTHGPSSQAWAGAHPLLLLAIASYRKGLSWAKDPSGSAPSMNKLVASPSFVRGLEVWSLLYYSPRWLLYLLP
ncbi:hypothetical protein B296_00021960 [Ensete ventricosum]|uniref:Uncharacterized protein n=1 Tax=Ensete ventricosum TaxID=4639 RepID=A0A426ZI07_ENSVE|nr:hypothetical protein B296_00021960 [Ensete ventricosum]